MRNGAKGSGWCTTTLWILANQMNETAWSAGYCWELLAFGIHFIGRCAHLYHFQHYRAACGCSKHGRMTYRNITQHYVLIGFNELSINMIRELYNECSSARILLMSGIEAATVRHRIQSALPIEIERQVLVYFGNIESIEELQRLNIASASEVYVLGDEERWDAMLKI